jgi:hypothetical protein
LYEGIANGKSYLLKNLEFCPRYARDQYIIFKKLFGDYSSTELEKAFDYCLGRELFYATDLKDTLLFFRQETPLKIPDTNTIPAKYSAITAPTRNLTHYSNIYGGKQI